MRTGASLVEVIVAFAVLGIALPGVFAVAAYAATILGHARLEEGATLLAEAVLDSLLRQDVIASGHADDGVYEIEWAGPAGGAMVDLVVRYRHAGAERELRFGAVHAPAVPSLPAP